MDTCVGSVDVAGTDTVGSVVVGVGMDTDVGVVNNAAGRGVLGVAFDRVVGGGGVMMVSGGQVLLLP